MDGVSYQCSPCELNSQFSGNSLEFLGILKNSQLCKWPLQAEFPVFWEFLGIPRNSQKFPTKQINSDLKSLELLGISGKGRLQFCEDLESLGIPRNSQLYKLPII